MPAKLVDMAVSNNILIVALDSFRLLRIDLDNPLEVEGRKEQIGLYKTCNRLIYAKKLKFLVRRVTERSGKFSLIRQAGI